MQHLSIILFMMIILKFKTVLSLLRLTSLSSAPSSIPFRIHHQRIQQTLHLSSLSSIDSHSSSQSSNRSVSEKKSSNCKKRVVFLGTPEFAVTSLDIFYQKQDQVNYLWFTYVIFHVLSSLLLIYICKLHWNLHHDSYKLRFGSMDSRRL